MMQLIAFLPVLTDGMGESNDASNDRRLIHFKFGVVQRVVRFLPEADAEAEHGAGSVFQKHGEVFGTH